MLIKCALYHSRPARAGLVRLICCWLTASAAAIITSSCASNHAYPDRSSSVTEPGAGGYFTPWPQRVGPAYPDDPFRSMGRDAKEFPAILADNTGGLAGNRDSLVLLALAGTAGIALRGPNADDPIASHYRRQAANSTRFGTLWETPAATRAPISP